MSDGVTPDLPEHVAANRAHWDAEAPQWVAAGERLWRSEPTWGQWEVPESELHLLPDSLAGADAIELGCGTGYVSAWLHRRGARVTGIDASERQLATARRLAAEHGVDITWLHGDAERVPLPDGSFDLAVSEYGAATWCDPYVWIPEAHRLLRPGGTLVFLATHPLAIACMPLDGSPAGTGLVRDWFGMHRLDWRHVPVDPGGVEFVLPTSAWFALLRDVGFDVVGYAEPRAPDPDADPPFATPAAWSHRFPSEHVWTVRKVSG